MPPPDIKLTYRDGGTGDAGDQYTGLDRFGRLVETLWKTGSTDQVQVRSKYGRNRFGGVVWRRDEEAHAQGVDTEDNLYGYDALQQVKARQRGSLTGTPPDYTGIANLQQQEGWTYDATGNWAACSDTSPTNAQTRTHNTANEITQIASDPGSIAPAYDPAGNMLTLPKQPGLSAEQYDLVWDAWNRLVAVKDGETTVASYTYDGLTRRQTKTNGAETRHYYYNVAWRALEERVEGASVPVDRQYTWGLRDRWDLVRRKRSVSGNLDETLYVLKDYLDPVAIVDESGDVVERYAYDAFGNARFLAPDYSTHSISSFDWDFLFHGEFSDPETTLYSYGYRYYDTGLGRWLSRDPIAETIILNPYQMAKNGPMDAQDVLGLRDKHHAPDNKGCGCICEWVETIKFEPGPRAAGAILGTTLVITVRRSSSIADQREKNGTAEMQYWEKFNFDRGRKIKGVAETINTWQEQMSLTDPLWNPDKSKRKDKFTPLDDWRDRPCMKSSVTGQDYPMHDPINLPRTGGALWITVRIKNPKCRPRNIPDEVVRSFYIDVDPSARDPIRYSDNGAPWKYSH